MGPPLGAEGGGEGVSGSLLTAWGRVSFPSVSASFGAALSAEDVGEPVFSPSRSTVRYGLSTSRQHGIYKLLRSQNSKVCLRASRLQESSPAVVDRAQVVAFMGGEVRLPEQISNGPL